MRALVLGGNGFIGSHIVDKLLVEGHDVRVFDLGEENYRKPLDKVDYLYGDFGNRGLLTNALKGVQTVFHLISTTLPETSNEDPIFDVHSNVAETIFLLEQCVAQQINKIVFISSGGTVYGIPGHTPVSEDNPTNPLCSYGITKLMIEKYLHLFKHLYSLDYVVIRPSNPYGDRQNPSGIQGAISVFLGKVARGMPIEIWGDGGVVRDYIFIDDLVEGIYKSSITDSKNKVFNLGSGIGSSIKEILGAIKNVTDTDVDIIYMNSRTLDVPEIYLDIARARSELSWSPKTSLEEGLAKCWKFVKQVA
ncbi:MAG: NAD-dependent epimerase/dehydratase family protein [Desulfuromonadales bacterium]